MSSPDSVEERESDKELLDRYTRVRDHIQRAEKQRVRLQLGSYSRTRKIMWIGALNFTLEVIRSEIEDRGLSVPKG